MYKCSRAVCVFGGGCLYEEGGPGEVFSGFPVVLVQCASSTPQMHGCPVVTGLSAGHLWALHTCTCRSSCSTGSL